jgi:hypothetical protein
MNWKRFLLISSSIILVAGSFGVLYSCFWADTSYEEEPKFFLSNITHQPAYAPFLYYAGYDINGFWQEDEDNVELPDKNSLEWRAYTRKKVKPEDIDSCVYSAPVSVLYDALHAIRKAKPLPQSDYAMVSYLYKQKDTAAINYLIYAKRAENMVLIDAYEWQKKPADTNGLRGFMANGIGLAKLAVNPFFKYRYTYQVLKLCFYNHLYSQTIQQYDSLIGKKEFKGEMYSRCLGFKAGALYRMGEGAKAAYFYSKVFEMNDRLKPAIQLSFHWCGTQNMEEGLRYCRNNHERAVMHVVNSLQEYYESDFTFGKQDMMLAYTLDPKVKGLDVLMTRQINKIEYQYYGHYLSNIRGKKDEAEMTTYEKQEWQDWKKKEKAYIKYLADLDSFSAKVILENKTGKNAYWFLASAYIKVMEGNIAAAEEHLANAEKIKMHPQELDVDKIIHAICIIQKTPGIDTATEHRLLPYLKWMEQRVYTSKINHGRFRKVYRGILLDVLSEAYWVQKDTLKYVLCMARSQKAFSAKGTLPDNEGAIPLAMDFDDATGNMVKLLSEEKLESLVQLTTTHASDAYMQWLCAEPFYTRDMLYEMEAMHFIHRANFARAKYYFMKMDKAYIDSRTITYPFLNFIKDYYEITPPPGRTNISRLRYVQEMLRLEKVINENPSNAKACFRYAEGLYNTSYYGYAYNAGVYFKHTVDDYAFYNRDRGSLNEADKEFYAVKTAEKYFMMAFNRAKNPELKARCLFMAAKCWQKSSPYNDKLDGNDYYLHAIKSPYFKTLYQHYRKTNYYNDAFTTCTYLRDFVTKHNSK